MNTEKPTREDLLDCIKRFVEDYYDVCGFLPHSVFGDTELEWMARWKVEDRNGFDLAERGRRLLAEAGITATPPRRKRPYRQSDACQECGKKKGHEVSCSRHRFNRPKKPANI